MTRRSFSETLHAARAGGQALWAFTCYDVTTAIGVLRGAAEAGRPVILLVSERSFAGRDGAALAAALVAVADASEADACVQLDHCASLDLVGAAVELGVGAVLADGSRLPDAENAAYVRAAVATASASGAEVEAELGRVAGDEDRSSAATADQLTDPEAAAAFVADTGAVCLAVSIGNVHGMYAVPPALDWARLAKIDERVPVPLALHGASGLPETDLVKAVARGIVKVNVNTELRATYLAAVRHHLEGDASGDDVIGLQEAVVRAVQAFVAGRMSIA